MSLAAIYAQFGRPRGMLGHLAGVIMATRPSNRLRNQWTIDLLDIGETDRVVELGSGPGLGLALAATKARRGLVTGIDHSPVMIAQARSRNRLAIAEGRLRLVEGGIEQLARFGPYDRAFSLNVIQFLPDKAEALQRFHAALAPGGRIATTYQPRHRNATADDARRMADLLAPLTEAAGFIDVACHELPLAPTPAIAVAGLKPG